MRVIAYCEACGEPLEIYEKFEYEHPSDLIELTIVSCECKGDHIAENEPSEKQKHDRVYSPPERWLLFVRPEYRGWLLRGFTPSPHKE